MRKITPKLLLRIASVIMLFHAVAHTLAILTWEKPSGKIPTDVVLKMQDAHFTFGGKDATMANFFSGHGYAGTIFLLLIVTILWVLSGWTDRNAIKILWIIGLAIGLLALDEQIYFFPMAAIFSLIAATLVFVSIFKLTKTELN